MAKTGFIRNSAGYAETLKGADAFSWCDAAGARICGSANAAGHGNYTYDTMVGSKRVHTRVKTADTSTYYRERRTHTLRNAVGH